jgi:hypothetical protein
MTARRGVFSDVWAGLVRGVRRPPLTPNNTLSDFSTMLGTKNFALMSMGRGWSPLLPLGAASWSKVIR